MHDFRIRRIIIWDIAKYKANTIIYLKNMEVRWQFPVAEPRRGELPFNDCKGFYSGY